MRLHVFPPSPNAIKVLAAAHLLDLPFESVTVDLFKGEQRSRAFTALNPNQRMPVQRPRARRSHRNVLLVHA